MQCDQFEQILEQQEDEAFAEDRLWPISTSARLAARSWRISDEIHDVAMELGAEGIAPPEHIWISLRNQLEAEGIIHDLQAGAADARPWLVERFSASRPGRRFSGIDPGRGDGDHLQAGFLPDARCIRSWRFSRRFPLSPRRIAYSRKKCWTVGNDSIPGLPEAGRRCGRFLPPEPRNC